MRVDGRANDALRDLRITPHFMPNSGGSCLIEWGNTRVLVTANVENKVPPFLAGKGSGWLTAEYAMLPGSTLGRKPRAEPGPPRLRAALSRSACWSGSS